MSPISFRGTLPLAIILAVSGSCLVGPAMARPDAFAGGGFIIGAPQGEFADNVDVGFGFNLDGGIRLGTSPLIAGVQFGYLIYGTETRKEPFSETIPDVTVDVETSNNLVLGHLFLRLEPAGGAVRPYAEGLVGLHYLFTDTKVKSEGGEQGTIAESTNFDDTTSSMGGGGGIKFRVWSRSEEEAAGDAVRSVWIDLGARYLKGGEASYLREGSVRTSNGRLTYDVKHSQTDIVAYSVGVAVHF